MLKYKNNFLMVGKTELEPCMENLINKVLDYCDDYSEDFRDVTDEIIRHHDEYDIDSNTIWEIIHLYHEEPLDLDHKTNVIENIIKWVADDFFELINRGIITIDENPFKDFDNEDEEDKFMGCDAHLAQQIIQDRQNEIDFYVLKYDLKTTDYNNEIEFKTYREALEEFKNAEPSYADERVELVFSPQEDDEEYYDNEVLQAKYYKEGE